MDIHLRSNDFFFFSSIGRIYEVSQNKSIVFTIIKTKILRFYKQL